MSEALNFRVALVGIRDASAGHGGGVTAAEEVNQRLARRRPRPGSCIVCSWLPPSDVEASTEQGALRLSAVAFGSPVITSDPALVRCLANRLTYLMAS